MVPVRRGSAVGANAVSGVGRANGTTGYSMVDCHPRREDILHEVVTGLTKMPKHLPPKLLYDPKGSALFDTITRQPEYYLTRSELSILSSIGDNMQSLVSPDTVIVELGSGSGEKTIHLLNMLPEETAYVAVDISASALDSALSSLAVQFPRKRLIGMVADYLTPLVLPGNFENMPKLFVFFGSTLGNFEPLDAVHFLNDMALSLKPHDALLVGIDLKKTPELIHRAYNDAAGVTAEFNYNVLTRINRDCSANFTLEYFRHEAEYQPDAGRVAMFLVSKKEHTVTIADYDVYFSAGEPITTEYSYKYSIEEFYSLAYQAGWSIDQSWTDANELFSMHYLRPDLV